jgi:hypothetical protein
MITFENFTDHINTEVYVEICCSEFGVAYPERNILVGMNRDVIYFKSVDDNHYWHWKNSDDCSVEIYPYAQHIENMEKYGI